MWRSVRDDVDARAAGIGQACEGRLAGLEHLRPVARKLEQGVEKLAHYGIVINHEHAQKSYPWQSYKVSPRKGASK